MISAASRTPLAPGAPPAALSRRDDWRLSTADVHARQSLSGFALSPDGSQIALVQVRDRRSEADKNRKRIKDTPLADVCLMPAAGGYPRPFTSTGNVSQPAVWSPDGQRLLLERDGALKSVPLAGGRAQTVYRGTPYRPRLSPGDAHLGWPRWSPDGRWVLTATRDGHETTLLLVSADGRMQRRLLTVDGTLATWDWAPDGRRVVLVTQSENTLLADLRLLDVASGDAHVLWEETHTAYQKPVAAWSPDGSRIVFRPNRSGWAKLWTATLDGAAGLTGAGDPVVRPLTTGDRDDYAFRCSPDGRYVVFASRAEQDGSGDDLWLVPIEGGLPARLTGHGGVNVPYGWGPDGRVAYWHSSPTEPGDLWSVVATPGVRDAAGRPPLRLTWSAPAELERKLSAPQEVVFAGADGQPVHALVYLPTDHADHADQTDQAGRADQTEHEEGRRYPPIVWVRGGPTGFSRFDYAPLLTWLANEGFLVITPNYRGSTGHGVPFMEAVAGDGLGKSDLADVLAAAAYVKGHPSADTRRGVGIGGRSWGGYLTLMAVTQAPETFSCAVAGAAISDWTIQQAQTESRAYDRWLVGGWLYEHEARARDRSPVTNVDRIKTPLLVYHGEADMNVPFAQIGPFVDKARQAGASVEYVTYPLEGHGNQLPSNQEDVLEKTGRFFRRHLQPWNFRDNPSAGQAP